MKPRLSIIIVNYNTRPLTTLLLKSLLPQVSLDRDEIIVVDNDSKDNSVPFLRADFPEVVVIDNKANVGLSAAVNVAIEKARGEFYLILNPDMVAMDGAVGALLDFMKDQPQVGMAGGKLKYPNGKLQYSCFRFYRLMTILYRRTMLGRTRAGQRELARFLMKDFNHQRVRDVDWLMGACLMVRAEAVEQVGGMDERYFMYFEDVDWCRRMWEAGWQVVYVPTAEFSHFYQQTSKRGSWITLLRSRAARAHIVSAVKYFWKFRGRSLPHAQ